MEKDESQDGGGTSSPDSPTQRQRRDTYNNWAAQRRPVNSSVQTAGSRSGRGFPLANISYRRRELNHNNSPQAASNAAHNQRGLNGVCQLANSLPVSESADDAATNQPVLPSSRTDNISNSNRSSNPHPGGRLHLRRRYHPPSNPGARPSRTGSSSVVAQDIELSPTRRSNFPSQFGQLSPALISETDMGSSVDLIQDTPLLPSPLQLSRVSVITPSVQEQGTEENPVLISPGSPESESLGRDGGGITILSDEELAQQLQQEEWEVASGQGPHDFPAHILHNPQNPLMGLMDFPPRRGRRSLSPLFHHHHQHEANNPTSRDGGGLERGGIRIRHYPGHPSRGHRGRYLNPLGSEGYPDMSRNAARQELAPFIFELFHSYGVPEFEMESLMNPDHGGDYESLLALAEQIGEVNRGMSQSDINKLPISKHTPTTQNGACAVPAESPQCNICLTDYEHGDKKRALPCQHDFHKDCVDQWLKMNGTCPVCRADVKAKFK